MKPKRLGRGLKGLIQPSEPAGPPAIRRTSVPPVEQPLRERSAEPAVAAPTGVLELPIGQIQPNPFQPRAAFLEEDLEELKSSIAEHGLLQPVVVRPSPLGYELIAGERRLRAVKALGRESIPAIIRHAEDEEMQTLALVENIQRVDLNAIEKARALKAMMRNFGLTQDDVAARVGKARTSISNLTRLLDLPGVIQDMVMAGELSGSQARAVLLVQGAERRIALAQRAAKLGLTVRKIERLAAELQEGGRPSGEAVVADPYIVDLETRLREALGTKVEMKARGHGGAITIRYHDAGELDRILALLGA